jgi:hypothetical protein
MGQRDHTEKFWGITLLAATMLLVTMGARQSLGLFVSPLNPTTGLGYPMSGGRSTTILPADFR